MGAVASDIRRAVYVRDGGRCRICAEPVGVGDFHVDHVVPRARGGGHEMANLQLAHANCNIMKNARSQAWARRRITMVGRPAPQGIGPLAMRKGIAEKGPRKIAAACDVSVQAVHGWLAGAAIKGTHLLRLADALGIPVDPRLKALAGVE